MQAEVDLNPAFTTHCHTIAKMWHLNLPVLHLPHLLNVDNSTEQYLPHWVVVVLQ